MLNVECTDFSVRAFGVFDANRDRRIDFLEFVHSVVYICSCNKMNLARFAFRLVDTDHSGSLSTDEVQNVVEIIYGDTVADYKNNVYRKRELAHETAVRVSVGDGAWCQIHSFIHSFIHSSPFIYSSHFHFHSLPPEFTITSTEIEMDSCP